MKFSEQVKLAKSTKQIHSTWYRETYPEVAELGLDPAAHYLRYGAALGRNPGKNFDTKFYLETYSDAANSGLNPLVHFALHGQAQGYATRPKRDDPRKQINVIRTKLLSLGFTERPLAELTEIATTSSDPTARALAARELALWHMRAKSDEDYRTALDWIARARDDAPDLDFRAKLSTVELLCHYQLEDHTTGRATYDRAALAGEATPDLTLARVNLEQTPEARVLWINQVLARYGIEPVTLLPDEGQPAYDRLTCAQDLPKITDGPKVTVLVAAYDAADMLPTALRSLQEQTWANLEIIVLDDCSPTMDTVRVAEGFAARDPRIQVVRMAENGGAYVARNHGLDMATGEFVTLHDADDWSHPRKIETQVRFMMDNAQVMGCTSEQARCDETIAFTKIRSNGNYIIFNTSSFLYRRDEIHRNLGYWDTARFGADNELVRRMQAHFGNTSLKKIKTGPLSFQREASSSITEDTVKGVHGFYYGVRLQYYANQLHRHETEGSLYYNKCNLDGNFPRANMMNPDRQKRTCQVEEFDVIIAADFRKATTEILNEIERIKLFKNSGKKVGLVNHYDYSLETDRVRTCNEVLDLLSGEHVKFIVFGEIASCQELIGSNICDESKRQRYTPDVSLVTPTATI